MTAESFHVCRSSLRLLGQAESSRKTHRETAISDANLSPILVYLSMSTTSMRRDSSSSGLAIDFSTQSLSSTISVSGSGVHSSTLSSPQLTTYSGGPNSGAASTAYPNDLLSDHSLSSMEEQLIHSSTPSLLARGSTPSQASLELRQILGNANSRLKSGAEIPFGSLLRTDTAQSISLEQAKSRSRVSLDIFLQSNVCVQGGHLRGHVQIRVKKTLKNQETLLISEGKLRLIGFESSEAERDHSIFYQCCAPLADVTLGLDRIFTSMADEEGFSTAAEGTYTLPFVMHLTVESESGLAKGTLPLQSGVSIRYIALVSIRIKDPSSDGYSIAHFYRDCIVWPRLDPRMILAPTTRPIQVTASNPSRIGGNGPITMTASLHRLHWIAGQFCFVKVKIVNDCDKALKILTLQLIRSMTVFRTGYKFDASMADTSGAITDVLQSSTTTKQVAQSVLEVCARGTRGHASAKGWWSGAIPGQSRSFSHYIAIPTDALSIPRGRLVEVSYTLQVIINIATVLPTSVKVSLPLEIINFVSLDPPHQGLITHPTGTQMPVSVSSESYGSYLTSPMESEYTEHDYDAEDSLEFEDKDVNNSLPADADLADIKSPPRFADLYYSSVQENLAKVALDETRTQDKAASVGSQSQEGHLQSTFATRVKEKRLERQVQASVPPDDTSESNDLKADSNYDRDSGYQSEATAQSTAPGKQTTGQTTPEPSYHTHTDTANMEKTPSNVKSARSTDENGTNSNSFGSPFPLVEPTTSRTPISGVALPNECIKRPYWKPAGDLARTGDTMMPPKPSPPIPEVRIESSSLEDPSSYLSTGRPTGQVNLSSPTAPRVGSVKDKIRELEQLAAKTDTVHPMP